MTLEQALAQVEAGNEPDWSLDIAIGEAIGLLKVDEAGRRYRINPDGSKLYGSLGDHVLVGFYTRDADDVDRLIESVYAPEHPGMEIHSRAIRGVMAGGKIGWIYFEEITVPSSEFQGRGLNRARSRLAALLRAMIRDEQGR